MNTRERTNARRALADKRGRLIEALQDLNSDLYKGLAITHDLPYCGEFVLDDPAGYTFIVTLQMEERPADEEET